MVSTFHVTIVWPRGQFPIHEPRNLVTKKNYHCDIEQLVSSPGLMGSGAQMCSACSDARYHRLGVNLPRHNFDGSGRVKVNTGVITSRIHLSTTDCPDHCSLTPVAKETNGVRTLYSCCGRYIHNLFFICAYM